MQTSNPNRHPDCARAAVEAMATDKQHGALSMEQALAAGMNRAQIRRRRDRRQWCPAGPRGWYILADHAEDPLAKLAAATNALDGPAWGSSALALVGLQTHPVQPMVATRQRFKGCGARAVWVEGLDELPTTRRTGLATVTVEVAIASQARWLGIRQLHSLIDEALRRQLTTWDRVDAALRLLRRRGRKGSGKMESVRLDRSGDDAVPLSDWGRDLVIVLDAAGLPTPRMEWRIHHDDGTLAAQVDAAYPAAGIAIELDSVEFHLNREAFEVDRQRDATLARLGWRVLRLTWTQWTEHRPEIIATIHDLLDGREPAQPPGFVP